VPTQPLKRLPHMPGDFTTRRLYAASSCCWEADEGTLFCSEGTCNQGHNSLSTNVLQGHNILHLLVLFHDFGQTRPMSHFIHRNATSVYIDFCHALHVKQPASVLAQAHMQLIMLLQPRHLSILWDAIHLRSFCTTRGTNMAPLGSQ
jgi:hypothetical protein